MNRGCVFLLLLSFIMFIAPVHSFVDNFLVMAAESSSLFTDKLQFYLLGNQDACESIKKDVRMLAVRLCIDYGNKIAIKKMSPFLTKVVGRGECIATHNAIFIDEQWLLSLSTEKRLYVLAHELMHIKNGDVGWKYIVFGSTMAVAAAVMGYSAKKDISPIGFGVVAATTGVGSIAALAAYHRHQEARADAGAETIAPGAFRDHYMPPEEGRTFFQKLLWWTESWFSPYKHDRFISV